MKAQTMFHKTRGSEIVLGQPKPDKSLSKLAEGLNPSEYEVSEAFLPRRKMNPVFDTAKENTDV